VKHRRRPGSRARLGNSNTHRPQPREHFALGLKAVANHGRASVLEALASKAPEKLLELGLHGLGNEALRTVTKHRAQEILCLRWPAKFNYRILLHGWRDSLCGLLKTISTIAFQQVTPPFSTRRRTPDSVIALWKNQCAQPHFEFATS
jgi:hypothetical protein